MTNPEQPPPTPQPWPPQTPQSPQSPQQPQTPPSPPPPLPPAGAYPPPGYGAPGGPAGPYPPPPYGGAPYGGYPMHQQPPYGFSPPPQTPATAVWALVLGIASIVMCGLFAGIPAIILGRSAVKEIDASRGSKGGRGLAQAGFITGIVGTALSALVLLIIVAAIIIAALAPDDGTTHNTFQVCRTNLGGVQHCTRT